eukprot:2084105-Rhodomonas_salina.1
MPGRVAGYRGSRVAGYRGTLALYSVEAFDLDRRLPGASSVGTSDPRRLMMIGDLAIWPSDR